MKIKIKMKRHESFSIREGWLTKGLLAIREDPKVFSSEFPTDVLGIGTNMVKSLKYWLMATNLVNMNKSNLEITEFGNLILKYDPYMESDFTWWLIHINLLLNIDDFYIGNLIFNKCLSKNFSKEEIFKICSNSLDMRNIEYNEKILMDEINMIIKTYVIDKSDETPENNFSCPLASLELLNKIGKDKYERIKPNYKTLNYLAVYYLLLTMLDGKEYISIDELITSPNSLAKILNLDKNLVNIYLDDMRRNRLITINRTAGLNMIYIQKKLNLNEIFEEYFGGEEL